MEAACVEVDERAFAERERQAEGGGQRTVRIWVVEEPSVRIAPLDQHMEGNGTRTGTRRTEVKLRLQRFQGSISVDDVRSPTLWRVPAGCRCQWPCPEGMRIVREVATCKRHVVTL